MEDTAFYRDFAVLALNEVGGDPRVASLSADAFHARMAARVRDWPLALNASATHDTKRGEDARMRLAMLPALAREWTALVPRLRAAAQPLRLRELHPADEYFIWQTLLALWPPPAADAPADGERERLAGRLGAYLIKALREGKLRSSWLAPDEAYENAAVDYAQALLDPVRAQPFQHLFLPFATQAARLCALASLAALTLKCTAPGIPDIYQGAECWDLSLVDPDNRRPVDYAQRERLLTECDLAAGVSRGVHAGQLLETWPDGRIKMYLLERLLHLRQRHAEVFVHGAYEPVAVHGGRADAVLAFQRAHHGQRIVVLVARIAPGLVADERCALRGECWGDTTCDPQAQSDWVEWLTGRRFARGPLVLSELLDGLPAAVLIAEGRDGTP
jgi:(1->4)-alpha-D-glucan 1-alpha-D-glucosylmutase